MNYWFIRLGKADDQADKNLYRDLAKNYSIVKIGYAIDKDFTKLENESEIEVELTKCLNRRNLPAKPAEIGARAKLINQFINEMNIGDIVISPFGDKTTKMRIGKVMSECKIVKSFFILKFHKLKALVVKHLNSLDLLGDVEIKPARKVKWLTAEMNFKDFPDTLQKALADPSNPTKMEVFRAAITLLEKLQDQNIESILAKIDSRLLEGIDGAVISDKSNTNNAPLRKTLIALGTTIIGGLTVLFIANWFNLT